MKNLYLFPTDKPSRLHFDGKLFLSTNPQISREINSIVEGKNIYITNSEEIKEGDWFFNRSTNTLRKYSNCNIDKADKKIILTTDQDLIKDGVQAIDDEFLQWFVNNPNCEFVRIGKGYFKNDYEQSLKIIIPSEEPKQETLEEAALKFYRQPLLVTVIDGFIGGAKWQQAQNKKMYNEDEVLVLLHKRDAYNFKTNAQSLLDWETPKEWLEQFKNE